MIIEPVDEPASFDDVKFTQLEWKAARKQGALKVPSTTAREALKYGKGLYRIKPVEKETVTVELKGLKSPDEMTSAELVAEMTSHGKPPRKKMDRKTAVQFVRDLREKAEAMIVEDEAE